jgi:two-component system sensor histidine kinase KdpD
MPAARNARHDAAARPPSRVISYAWAIGVVLLSTAIGWAISYGPHVPDPHAPQRLANSNVLMLYLLGVLWIATRYRRGAAILASLLGVAAFDFCFVPPYFRFNVADEQYVVTFAVMLVTALTISTLTHRVRVQSAATRAAWERVEMEFLRNTLLSGVSHELRTPLAAITGAASTLIETRDQLTPPARAEMLETIYDEADRMERLINNLLEMTRLESGELIVKQDWVPLQELIGSALHRLDRALNGRDVKIDVPHDLPLAFIDSVGIEQVLVNLIDNALQYTPAGTAIDITARAGTGDLTVEVADHGAGLRPGAEGRVFEKFFRSHGDRPERGRGIGLGLAICRAIVEAHGGTITAANRAGAVTGAVFRFTLPQRKSPPVVDATG